MKLFTLYGDLELAAANFNSGVAAARAEMQDLKKDMEGLQGEADKTGGVLEGALGHALGDILSGITEAAIETAFTFFDGTTEIAADMENLNNSIEITFGNSASRVESWAKSARSSFGLGKLSAMEYTDAIGSMLKQTGVMDDELVVMSTNLVGVASDLATLKNANASDVVKAMTSALRGEAESIEKFNIFVNESTMATYALNQGLIDTAGGWSKLDEGTKMMARYSAIMEQTSDVQGYFAENSGSYTAQLAQMEASINNLRISVGESLLPVMTDLVSWFNSLFGSQEDAIRSTDDFKESYADSFASIETTTTSALALVRALDELSASTEDAASTETWNAILKKLQQTIPGLGGLINEETGKIEGGTRALKDYVEQWRETSMELARQKAVQDMYEAYGEMQGELAKLQTTQTIADIRRTGAEEAMADLGSQLYGYMIAGMQSMGAKPEYVQFMEKFGAEVSSNMLSSMADGVGANVAMAQNRAPIGASYMTYFLAGGGTQDVLQQLVDLYAAQEKIAEEYDVDYRSQIAEYEEALANKDAELDILSSYISKMEQRTEQPSAAETNTAEVAASAAAAAAAAAAATPAPVINVTVTVDGQELAAVVTPTMERAISRSVAALSR